MDSKHARPVAPFFEALSTEALRLKEAAQKQPRHSQRQQFLMERCKQAEAVLADKAGRSPGEVLEYRVFKAGLDGRFTSFRAFECDDEGTAIFRAKKFLEDASGELWLGSRLIARLNA